MQPFAYERPRRVEDATALLMQRGARVLAGGTDLIAQLKEGRRTASIVVDVKAIPEMVAIARGPDGGWRIGAAASIRALGGHAGLMAEHGALVQSARLIGSLQIQSRATLGGNVCNAAPSADAVPLLVALGATGEIAGPGGRRTLPVEDMAQSPGRVSLAPGEILVSIHLPARGTRSGAYYLRFTPRREMDIAIAGSGVSVTMAADGTIADARIVLASVGPTPVRCRAAEAFLAGRAADDQTIRDAARMAAGEAKPISDTRGSADYRRHLADVLTRRALSAALMDAEQRKAAA